MLVPPRLLTSAMGSVVATRALLSRGGVLLHAAPMFHLADIASWTMGLLTGSTHVMVPGVHPGGRDRGDRSSMPSPTSCWCRR